jgi:hypothetical protein
MPKVMITAQVEDGAKWEASFRTHVNLFKTYTLRAPIEFTVDGNEVAICMEPENVDTLLQSMESQPTIDAMAADGVKRETVKAHVLNKQVKL